MKNYLLLLGILLFYSFSSTAQSSITFSVTSMKPGDSCTVMVQKSSELFYYKKLRAGADSTASHSFQNLSNGKWAVKLDATGYYYPTTKVIDLNNENQLVEAKLTRITLANNVNYYYEWQDDSSYVGHAQQTYINGNKNLVILNDTIKIPDDFSSINLLNTHGIALSDKITPWTSEDAYRLFEIVKKVPVLAVLNQEMKKDVSSVWTITNDEVVDDISIVASGTVKYVTISRKAFVYATPLIAELDGIKGKFFSKRLHHAVVSFATDFGRDLNSVSFIAQTNFGIRFLESGAELQNLMNEDPSNFQPFSAFEKLTVLSMFEELPDGMHIQNNLKYLVHRIAGQVNPKYPAAGAIAWIGTQTIEFMQSAFSSNVYFDIQRLILHEKTHFLWAGLFEQKLKDDWAELGGWHLDPTAASGWSTTRTTEFVSAYAHALNPDEDMAESVSFYVTNPDMLMSRSIRKFEFVRDRIMHGTRYVAQIRKDLTFTVYNLLPDYNYPGKIESVNVNVLGGPDQDKKLMIELRLHAVDSLKDGAVLAYTRISSSIGTFFDMSLSPVNENLFFLRGEIAITKFAKSGYWTVNQIMTRDAVGNDRYENNNTFGLKIFINNPLEDVTPPKYVDKTLRLSTGTGQFNNSGSQNENGKTYQYLQSNYDILEKNELEYFGLWMAIPKNDELGVKQNFQFPNQVTEKIDSINKSIKHITVRTIIPEYFPKGYYSVTQMRNLDNAQNVELAFFMNDTTLFKARPPAVTKHIHDSIYIESKYPDFVPPRLDVNQITISATPTNPSKPDGETHFEMDFFAKDSSAFVGHESGLWNGYYTLRDPQGKQFSFGMQGDFNTQTGTDFYYLLEDPSGTPGDWRKYKVKTLLPRGSAPGEWGVESITLYDRARNKKFFSFVELVRFDIEEKDSAQQVYPSVRILNKKVNVQNADSISMSVACKNCADKLYRARIYSDMGGNSVVYEGKMSSDSIVINNIKLSGVPDGILFATVFITDSVKVLLGMGKSSYAKDVIPPKSAELKTNLSNFGKSNIDSLVVAIKTTERNGAYSMTLEQLTVTPPKAKSAVFGSSILENGTLNPQTINGTYTDGNFQVSSSLLNSFDDGLIRLTFMLKDSVDNKAEPVVKLLYKDTKAPLISLKSELNNELKSTYSIVSDEFISNEMSISDIKVSNGTVSLIEKLNDKYFKITVNRSCNDTVNIQLVASALKDTAGNGSIAMNQNFVNKMLPAGAGVISGTTIICSGQNAVSYTAPAIANTTSYIWSFPAGISGTSSTNSITVDYANAASSGNISLKGHNVCGEGAVSNLTITVKPKPVTPMVVVSGNVLHSDAPSGNQWYNKNSLISDAKNQDYTFSVIGDYSVIVTINGCASEPSIVSLITGFDPLDLSQKIMVYPNPFIDNLVIESKGNFEKIRYVIVNTFGQIIYSGNLLGKEIIPTTSFTSGIYFIKFDMGKTMEFNKIIKN